MYLFRMQNGYCFIELKSAIACNNPLIHLKLAAYDVFDVI
uniref:Uncharacterized protein n=1 Tax=Arundo donax TaxID=35708 RepID=A0A0A8ZGD3_ARUDO